MINCFITFCSKNIMLANTIIWNGKERPSNKNKNCLLVH